MYAGNSGTYNTKNYFSTVIVIEAEKVQGFGIKSDITIKHSIKVDTAIFFAVQVLQYKFFFKKLDVYLLEGPDTTN